MAKNVKKTYKYPHQKQCIHTAWKKQTKTARLIDRIQIKTRCKPGTTWRGEETPRQPGISACPVHPGDRWLIAFLLADGIRRQGTVWPRGFFSVSRPGGGGSEGRRGGEPPPLETTITKAPPMLMTKIKKKKKKPSTYYMKRSWACCVSLSPHNSQWVKKCRSVHGSKYVLRGGLWCLIESIM